MVLSLFAVGTGACAVAKSDESQASKGPPPRSPEVIYARTCGYCHGTNVGPIIRGRKLPPEAIAYMVRHGQGAMPAFRPTEITDAELKALSIWISTSKADPKEHGR
jgi:mono/diheme cytochrome c family protein